MCTKGSFDTFGAFRFLCPLVKGELGKDGMERFWIVTESQFHDWAGLLFLKSPEIPAVAVAGGNLKRGMGIPTNLRGWELSRACAQSHAAGVHLVKMHIPLQVWFGNSVPWNLGVDRLGTNQDVNKMLIIVIAQKQEKKSVGFQFCSEIRFGVTQNSWKWIGEVTTLVLYLTTLHFLSALKILFQLDPVPFTRQTFAHALHILALMTPAKLPIHSEFKMCFHTSVEKIF